MRRILCLVPSFLLIASICVSAMAGGYLQTSHEIARAGHATIVICGEGGVQAVTLDRDGNPVQPAKTSCGHCADCFTTPLFDVPALAQINQGFAPQRQNSIEFTNIVAVSRSSSTLARGPPHVVTV
ncbi:hypothetical protein [Cognatishimia sp. WU-CL00825]|uniref:hypothetical protein n=1 Tax=Cognatishimia sp. WU-CL00825 TaxID=3127658 RepID=UPI0033654257